MLEKIDILLQRTEYLKVGKDLVAGTEADVFNKLF